MTVARPGNPHGRKDDRDPLVRVTFRLDQPTYERLRAVERETKTNTYGVRSRFIRDAILEKLDRSKK